MEINKDTKLYGSFSSNPGNNGTIFFNNIFKSHGIDAIYKSFFSTDAEKLVISVKHLNFSGFALSMPLKVEIMKYLDEIDESALEIGAVNTVVNNNGKLKGYNTDWIGVKKFILNRNIWFPFDNPVVILGRGGFSKAIQYTLKKLNVEYRLITRDNWDEIKNLRNTYIINATPVDIELKDNYNNFLIDGRPFTDDGKEIAHHQAMEQFNIYTNGEYKTKNLH